MVHFWDFNAWGVFNTLAVLLLSLMVAHILKENLKILKKTLIPTSVLGGLILLIISTTYNLISGEVFFELTFFGNGSITMEVVAYHALALGFIASTLKKSNKKFDKNRNVEIFNTGLTTVASYLMQGALGIGITMIAVYLFNSTILSGSGALLPFGYGQGTGQALNYGTIFEEQHNFYGGAHFGLTIAALGFLSACIGGVIYLNYLKRKGKLPTDRLTGEGDFVKEIYKDENEIPTSGSIDKMSVQIALVAIVYLATFAFMYLISSFFGEGLKSTIFGLNFLIGVIFAILFKTILNALTKENIIKKQYTNNYLLTRISNTCFDIMIVAGIAVIRIDYIKNYWLILLILGVVGAVSTFYYNLFVAKKLFGDYYNEQFLVMYGMLTGTASTGIILLREIDGEFKTPAEQNLIYQNLPAIIFGFPLMFLVLLAPKNDVLTLILLVSSFIVINLLLFRKQIFKKKQKNTLNEN